MKIRRQQFRHGRNVEGVHALAHERRKCPQIGVIGTNVLNAALVQRDVHGKRTMYGSLGLERVVFPRTTYQTYLAARLKAHILDTTILGPKRDLESRAVGSGLQPVLRGAVV